MSYGPLSVFHFGGCLLNLDCFDLEVGDDLVVSGLDL